MVMSIQPPNAPASGDGAVGLASEKKVIGILMLHPDRIPDARVLVRPGDFTVPAFEMAYASLLELEQRGEPIDPCSVAERVRADAKQFRLMLADAMAAADSSTHLAHHAGRVRAASDRLGTIRTLEGLLKAAKRTAPRPDTVAKLHQRIQEQTDAVEFIGQRARPAPLSEALKEVQDGVEEAASNGGNRGIRTGIRRLDECIQGLKPGTLNIVAGRPGSGKSGLLATILANVASTNDHNCRGPARSLLFTLEMSRREVAGRMVAMRAGLNTRDMDAGRLGEAEIGTMDDAVLSLGDLPISIDDCETLSVLDLASRARRHQRTHGLDLVLVDYMQLLKGPKSEARHLEIAGIGRHLKALARELNLPVIAACQLNRQSEMRDKGIPRLSDLRESGSLEQDADVVVLIHRPELHRFGERPGEADLIVAKHRAGPTGVVPVAFRESCCGFSDLEMMA